MATITNIRIYTQSKAVPNAGYIAIDKVMMEGNTIVAMGGDVRYVLGAVPMENIVVDAPSVHEECGCNTANANIFATLIKGVDGITPDMSDYYDKGQVDNKLSAKQDVITDIDVIRRNATKGANALQSVPSEYVTETELQEKGYATTAQVDAKQDKISDLDAIRQGASKGATAVQPSDVDSEVSETSTNPVQNKAVAGAFNEIVGLLDTTLSSVGERFNSKQDKLVSGENIKTINGESIIGEGDITIEGGSGGDLSGYATEEYVNNAVEEVNVKGEDGYVYSNGEKVDMRFTRSLIPVGTSIPAKANLNTVTYLKVGKYYCSLNADAKTITNCPTSCAFMMEVFNLLSTVVDNEVDSTYVYRIRIITVYSTGIQYFQYCTVGSTANKWTYDSWYVCPRTKFTLNSSKNDGSAAIGAKTQGVYVDSTGTLQKMTYSLNKSVPSNAVFTDTNTKVTSVDNHYAPAEDADAAINAPDGEVVIGLKRDAAGHIVGVMSTPMSSGGGGGGGGIAVETDPIFSASPAASITDADKVAWNNKVDYANKSLSIVGADGFMTSEGEGFVLPNTPAAQGEHGLVLATLDDIPDELTESDIAAMGFTKNEGTITEVKMNGESKGTGGVVDLGNVITEHQDISGKQDKISDLDNIRSGAEKGATALQASDVDSEMSEVSTNPIQNKTFSQAFMHLIEEFGLALESKQDNITDLQTIREGAAKGATAVQPGDIQDEVYITDFDVLSLESLVQNREGGIVIDKQGLMDALARHKVILVPYEISDNVTAKGYCTLVGYYEDLLYIKVIAEYKEIIVETSLNYPDIYCQEVTLRWWADKQDALVSGKNIKTINGESLLGSGDITISGGGASGSAQLPVNYISSNIAQACLIPSGMVTIFSTPQTEGVTMRLSTVGMESGKDNAWVIRFSIGADNTGAYVVESEDNFSLKWANGIAPTFENGKCYEMSFRLIGTMFLGVWASFE